MTIADQLRANVQRAWERKTNCSEIPNSSKKKRGRNPVHAKAVERVYQDKQLTAHIYRCEGCGHEDYGVRFTFYEDHDCLQCRECGGIKVKMI